ncbi:MAG: hypothetical protein GWO02_01430 [Gammaproteobacteria bacterium]|nr:hypothetical protein [Gammaproteobacteria bacterium]
MRLWTRFAVNGVVVAAAGWVLAQAGGALAARTRLSATVVGAVLTAASTSLPQLITAVAAVRLGALTLAAGDVVGDKAFDTLLIAFSDAAYRDGSVYAAVSGYQVFLLALTILLIGVLLMGLLHREKHGFANIGLESVLVIVLYLGSLALLAASA